ncbi:glycosyltransferase [Algoriphagus namhaensis]
MADFLIITCVQHTTENGRYFGYGPYVREMNLWIAEQDKVVVMAPLIRGEKPGKIDLPYDHDQLHFQSVPAFDIQSPLAILKACVQVPYIFLRLWIAMASARHIHIRIPGNMGLLGMITQIFFPWKKKTIKYAGNWDPESSQPLTYRIQRKIANSKVLTKNAKVLVYGDWPDSTSNVVPFYTASYWEAEKALVQKSSIREEVKLVFVGAIYDGKNPFIGVEVSRILKSQGIKHSFQYCGDGVLKGALAERIKAYGLEDSVKLLGNVSADTVKEKLRESHFLVFVSETEGWPKAVAEAMFWGCVPITSSVSCVPQMVGEWGDRGFLVPKDPEKIASIIAELKEQQEQYNSISRRAMDWSRAYTLDKFQEDLQQFA